MAYKGYSEEYINVSPMILAKTRERFGDLEYMPTVLYKNNSRYSNLRTIQDEDGNIYHESWEQKFIAKSEDDIYFVVQGTEENRLDIVANRFYGTPRYWWVIAMANYIIDPFDVPIGKQLRIPPLSALYLKGGALNG